MLRELFTARRDYNELAASYVSLLAERDRARYEAAIARKEAYTLRRRLKDSEMGKVRRAHADALLLGALHFGYQSTSRAACVDSGIMSERRWNRATALARLAGTRDRQNVGWHEDLDAETYIARIDAAAERVKAHGYDLLRNAMPRRGK